MDVIAGQRGFPNSGITAWAADAINPCENWHIACSWPSGMGIAFYEKHPGTLTQVKLFGQFLF